MLARGNIASPKVVAFSAALTVTLNSHGCRRTVAEWQSIWSQWTQKVKSKYRKYREQTQGTGGGPAVVRPLTDTELKVLEVVGKAAVDGFTNQETPLVGCVEISTPAPAAEILGMPPPVDEQPPAPAQLPIAIQPSVADHPPGAVQPPIAVQPSVTVHRPLAVQPPIAQTSVTVHQPLAVQPSSAAVQPPSSPAQLRSSHRPEHTLTRSFITSSQRRQRKRPSRPKPAELLQGSLDRNHELFRSTITQAAETLASAIREAGEAISSAIRNHCGLQNNDGGGQSVEYLDEDLLK